MQTTRSADPTRKDIEQELLRRHRATATTVGGLLVATFLLVIAAFLSEKFLRQQDSPTLRVFLQITILILGLGAIALRRTKFSPMRLQDIGGLAGSIGLLKTLEKTTLAGAFIGAAIALLGFVGTLVAGDPWYTFRAGVVSVAVLLYCYPIRSSWQRTLQKFASADNSDQV